MNSNYINNLSKSQVEDFVNTLEENKQKDGYTYSATYMSTKNSTVMEVIDARTRLGTIENKEAIDSLNERLTILENSSSNTPSMRLVKHSDIQVMEDSSYYESMWTSEPIFGNGIWVVFQGGGLGLSISTDNGANFAAPKYSELVFNGEGLSPDERMFRYSEVVFFNNTFYCFLPRGNEWTGVILKTTDFKNFTYIENVSGKDISSGLLFELDNNIYFIANKNLLKVNLETNKLELEAEANTTPACNYIDLENIFIKFNNKYYTIAYDKDIGFCETDLTTYTKVVDTDSNSIIDDAEYCSLLNGKLYVSNKSSAKYTDDLITWKDVALPYTPIMGQCGIRIHYVANENAYYGFLYSRSKYGFYKWTDLDSEPISINEHTSDDNYDGPAISSASDIVVKQCNEGLYFTATLKKYVNSEQVYSKQTALFKIDNNTIHEIDLNLPNSSNLVDRSLNGMLFTAQAYRSIQSGTVVVKCGDTMYITSASCSPCRKIYNAPIYQLKPYSSSNEDDEIIIVAK